MAQRLFTGQYGPLSQVDTRPIMAAGQAWGQAIQGTLENVGKAIEKHQLNKQWEAAEPKLQAYADSLNLPPDQRDIILNSIKRDKDAMANGYTAITKAADLAMQQKGVQLTQQRLEQQLASEERAKQKERFDNFVTVMSNKLSQGQQLDPENLQAADEMGQAMGLPPGMARNLAEEKSRQMRQKQELIDLEKQKLRVGIDVTGREMDLKEEAQEFNEWLSGEQLTRADRDFELREYISEKELDLAKDKYGLMEDEFNWRKGLERDKLAVQKLKIIADATPKEGEVLDRYRKEVKARVEDILQVKHAGKTYNLSIGEIEKGVADGTLPKALLQSSRYQEQLKRISAARQPLDKLIRSKTVLVNVPDDGTGAGTVLQDPAARGGIVTDAMTPEMARGAVADEVSRYVESLRLMRARAQDPKTTLGERQRVMQEIERQAKALRELQSSKYYRTKSFMQNVPDVLGY